MNQKVFATEKISKRDLAGCYVIPYTTFGRRIRAIADDDTNSLRIHKNHYFSTREVNFIIEELGQPKYNLKELREVEKQRR
jgi:hypothetical protein